MPVHAVFLAALCSCAAPQPDPAQCPLVVFDAASEAPPTQSTAATLERLQGELALANALVAEAIAEECDASCPMPSPEGGKP